MAYLKKLLISLLQLALVVAVIFAVFLIWIRWDISNLESFCSDVEPDSSLSSLKSIAGKHGLEDRVSTKGMYREESDNWLIIVPSPATMGEVSCLIQHDTDKILSAEMSR